MFFGDLNFPISAKSVQCLKYRGASLRICSFVHTLYRLRILDPLYVQLAAVDIKASSSVLLETGDHR